MKNLIIYILLIPFLTNCATITGITIDSIIHNKSKKKYNIDGIHQENQSIVIETIDHVRIRAKYNGLTYKSDSTYSSSISGKENNKINHFPRIGDYLSVFYGNEKKVTGEFMGIYTYKSEFQFMVFIKDIDKTEQVLFSSINRLTWNDNLFEIRHPKVERLFLKYQDSNYRSEIAFSELKHLNTKAPERKWIFTNVGIGIDAFLGVVALISIHSLGGLDFGSASLY